MSTFNNCYLLSPSSGNDTTNWQTAVDYVIANPGWKIVPLPGTYTFSSPVIIMNGAVDGTQFASLKIEGVFTCKDSTSDKQAIITTDYTDKPAFIVQRGKDVIFENICGQGLYALPGSVTQTQLQTWKYADWETNDTSGCRHNRYSPYCFCAIDPFSDPANPVSAEQYPGLSAYYVTGISRGGSSGVCFNGCRIFSWVVGLVFQPTNQQNGDMCHCNNTAIEFCKIGAAYCQPQTKGNVWRDMRCWGPCYTWISTLHYGLGIGLMPYIDGANIAGGITQIFYCPSNNRFSATATKIYAESVYKIGLLGGDPVPAITDSFFDFIIDGWMPDFFIFPMNNVNFHNCVFRLYNGNGFGNKLNFAGFSGAFVGGSIELPYLTAIQNSGSGWYTPEFYNVTYLDFTNPGPTPIKFNDNSGLSPKLYLKNATLTVNSGTFTATVDLGTAIAAVAVNDYLCAGEENTKFYEQTTLNAPVVQLGRISSIAGTVATLDQVSVIATSQAYDIYRMR